MVAPEWPHRDSGVFSCQAMRKLKATVAAAPAAPMVIVPRSIFPLALCGTAMTHCALPPWKRPLVRSRALPIRAVHLTVPDVTLASVSERVTTERTVNMRPATGRTGAPAGFVAESVGGGKTRS